MRTHALCNRRAFQRKSCVWCFFLRFSRDRCETVFLARPFPSDGGGTAGNTTTATTTTSVRSSRGPQRGSDVKERKNKHGGDRGRGGPTIVFRQYRRPYTAVGGRRKPVTARRGNPNVTSATCGVRWRLPRSARHFVVRSRPVCVSVRPPRPESCVCYFPSSSISDRYAAKPPNPIGLG